MVAYIHTSSYLNRGMNLEFELREHFFANEVKIKQFSCSNVSIQRFEKIQHLSKVIDTLIFTSVKPQSY